MGLGFLGESLGLWKFELFFSNCWPFFIIIPCITHLLEFGMRRSNVIGMTIGTLLLLSSWTLLASCFVIPILFIVIGIVLVIIPTYQGEEKIK